MNLRFFSLFCLFFGLINATTSLAQNKIGVLFGSYGDIDDVEKELRPFVRNTLTDPDILPLPNWLRATIADAGWYIERAKIKDQYAAIGGRTNMRTISKEQAALVAKLLKNRGFDAQPYVGFTMTTPFVSKALDDARRDGIDKLYVLYQGAQYAHDTAQILFRHIQKYLKKYPEWQVDVIGIRSFSDDPRLIDLIEKHISKRIAEDFAEFNPDEICIFLTAHGNLVRPSEEDDPYLYQVMRLISHLKDRLPSFDVSFGFHNHDEIPILKWSQPSNEKALKILAKKSCKGVLVNGQISFTVDNLETLYNQAIEIPQILKKAEARLSLPSKKVVVEKIFNNDEDFSSFLAELVIEADRGEGDLMRIRP